MNADLLAGNIAAHWIQSGLLSGSLLVALGVLSVGDPRVRLAALQLVFVAILLLPVMQPWRSDIGALPALSGTAMIEADVVPPMSSQIATFAKPRLARLTAAHSLVAVVAAGIVLRLSWVFYGLLQLGRFTRRSPDVPAPAVAGELEARMGVAPRYVRQTDSRGPWTFGFLRSTVALPARFDALDPGFQRAIVCHELHHVKRRDVAVAFAEELAAAILWFHPWIWLLRARIRIAREQVVDAGVVTSLGNRDEYIRCLVNLAGHDLAPHLSEAGAGMMRPRELRARVDAMFQEVCMSRTRFSVAAFTFVTVTIATALMATALMPLRAQGAAVVGADAPRRQINMVYPEYPQDALARGIRGTVIVDITMNADGDVTTAAVQSGPQELRASAFKAALALKFTKGASTTAMPIAFHYMLTDLSWGVKIGDALPNIGLRPLATSPDGGSTPSGAGEEPDATGAYRVGATVRPPRKLMDVAPQYPALAQSAGVQGVVILEARIDENGNVGDTRVLRSIPLLDQAAVDAVKQWRYEPVLMNGVAVPIIMTVTVHFSMHPQVRMRVTLPEGFTADPAPVGLTIRQNQMGLLFGRDVVLGLRPSIDSSTSPSRVKIDIYRVIQGANGTAFRDRIQNAPESSQSQFLGTVLTTVGAGSTHSSTTPSIGIEVLAVR